MNSYETTSEIADLTVKGGNMCKNWPDFPLSVTGAFGGFIGDSVIICGGRSAPPGTKAFDECYSLTSEKITFITHMSVKREAAASIVLNGTTLWITGGTDYEWDVSTGSYIGSGYLSSTEYVTISKTMPGPDMPIALEGHTMVAINKTCSMIIGGSHGEAANYCLENFFYVRNSKFFGIFNFI